VKPIWVDTISEITNGLCRICILAMACLWGVHCIENPIYVFPEMKLRSLVPSFLYACICEQFIHSQDRSAYLAAAKQADGFWEFINCSQIKECGSWEAEHYNSVLE
jgi:hypothetical protein